MEVSALKYSGGLGLHGRSPLLRLQSDERLITLLRRGNTGAFEVLVSRYESRLLSFCRHLLGSREDAEDVLQEVLTAAFNAILADNRPINVRPWLYRIARNRSLNHLRRIQAIGVDSMDHHFAEHGASTADKVHNREEFRLLVGDIQDLPESQRTALVLREMDALSYEQIAEAMETTIPSVKSLLVRARVSLAEAAEARLLTCDEVRVELAEVTEGLVRRPSPLVRRHLRDCERCTVFKGQLRQTNKALAALLPLGPLVALRQLLFLHVSHSAGSSATAAGASAGGAGAGGAGAAGAGAGAAGAGAGAVAVAGAGGMAGSSGLVSAGIGAIAGKAAAGLAAAALVTAGAVEVHHAATVHHHTSSADIASVAPVHSTPAVTAQTGSPAQSHAEPRSTLGIARKLTQKTRSSKSPKPPTKTTVPATTTKTTTTSTTPTTTATTGKVTTRTGRTQTEQDPTVLPPTTTGSDPTSTPPPAPVIPTSSTPTTTTTTPSTTTTTLTSPPPTTGTGTTGTGTTGAGTGTTGTGTGTGTTGTGTTASTSSHTLRSPGTSPSRAKRHRLTHAGRRGLTAVLGSVRG